MTARLHRLALLVVIAIALHAYGAQACEDRLNKACTPPGAQGNAPECCAEQGLWCPPTGPQKNHCQLVGEPDPGPTPPAQPPPDDDCSELGDLCGTNHLPCCDGLACDGHHCFDPDAPLPLPRCVDTPGNLCGGDHGDCCTGLVCAEDHCAPGGPLPEPPTTTTRPTLPQPTTTLPSVTTTTVPRVTTTTLPRPTVPAGTPIRFGPSDVGIRFRASQELLWNPTTGLPSTQYEAGVRVATMHWVMLPAVLRLLRDTRACSVGSGLGGQVRDMTGKFLILYSLRPLRAGDVYQYRGNYVFDLPMGLFRRAANCVPPEQWGNLAPLFAPGPPPPPHQTRADRSHVLDGLLDAKATHPPLSVQQCGLLNAAHAAHERHAAALLAHDPNAGALASAVVSTQIAFEASARSVDEQSMFMLVFTGDIDPQRSDADVIHFTEETSRAHHEWAECFHCDTGAAPDMVCAWEKNLLHSRAHFLRAITLPGLKLRKPCPLDIHYCPVTDD